ncbi:hypothetical protein BDZ89DRAFT_175614 [Hymenopellis radicata]|nr:hypothetical protein BDZ89DRAFT_175614 [Hymenopellis radicata]
MVQAMRLREGGYRCERSRTTRRPAALASRHDLYFVERRGWTSRILSVGLVVFSRSTCSLGSNDDDLTKSFLHFDRGYMGHGYPCIQARAELMAKLYALAVYPRPAGINSGGYSSVLSIDSSSTLSLHCISDRWFTYSIVSRLSFSEATFILTSMRSIQDSTSLL